MKILITSLFLGLSLGAAVADDECTAYLLDSIDESGQLEIREEFTVANSSNACHVAISQCQTTLNKYQDEGKYLSAICDLNVGQDGGDIFIPGEDGPVIGTIDNGPVTIPTPRPRIIIPVDRPALHQCQVNLLETYLETVYNPRIGRYVRRNAERAVRTLRGRGYSQYTACHEAIRQCERLRRGQYYSSAYRCESSSLSAPRRRRIPVPPVVRPRLVTESCTYRLYSSHSNRTVDLLSQSVTDRPGLARRRACEAAYNLCLSRNAGGRLSCQQH